MSRNQVISVILKEDIELLQILALGSHVWVINTPKVRDACLSIWSLQDINGYSLTHFNVDEIGNEKNNLEQALDSIDAHHSSEFRALGCSEINIYSSSLTDSDITALLDSSKEALVECSASYKVIRKNGA